MRIRIMSLCTAIKVVDFVHLFPIYLCVCMYILGLDEIYYSFVGLDWIGLAWMQCYWIGKLRLSFSLIFPFYFSFFLFGPVHSSDNDNRIDNNGYNHKTTQYSYLFFPLSSRRQKGWDKGSGKKKNFQRAMQ